jgi:transcriptional regulator with XRE-family HTH domain
MITQMPENWREILAKNIIEERTRLNLLQKELANKVGLKDASAISVWENGKGRFNIDILVALCGIFGRTPNDMMYSYLIGESPPPTRPPERPPSGENTEGVVQESGGVARAAPLAQNKGDDLKEMRRQMLEMMMKLENLDGAERDEREKREEFAS